MTRARVTALMMLAGTIACYRDAAPPAARPREHAASTSTPTRPVRVNALFPIAEVRAIHKCTPDAPPTVVVLLQSQGSSTSWFQIDLDHGERDRAPRSFVIGKDARVTGCRLACGEQPTGTVTLDTLEPGRRASGRYRLVFDNGDILEDGYEAAWQGRPWETQLCPRS